MCVYYHLLILQLSWMCWQKLCTSQWLAKLHISVTPSLANSHNLAHKNTFQAAWAFLITASSHLRYIIGEEQDMDCGTEFNLTFENWNSQNWIFYIDISNKYSMHTQQQQRSCRADMNLYLESRFMRPSNNFIYLNYSHYPGSSVSNSVVT